jgi:hypothetical protein
MELRAVPIVTHYDHNAIPNLENRHIHISHTHTHTHTHTSIVLIITQ